MRNTLSISSLFRQVVIRFLLLTIGLLILFLTLAWLNGALQLPDFITRPAQGELPTGLIINVFPENAAITLNDQPYNPKDILVPGDYIVRVTYDGFFPAEEHVRIHPNQKNQLIIRLMPITTPQFIANDSAIPGWDQQGDLFFLNLFEGKIFKWSENIMSPVTDVVGGIFQLLYLPTGTHVIALVAEGPESESKLQIINLQTKDITDLKGTGFVSLGPDGETVWGFNYDPDENIKKPVWSLDPGGSPKLLPLDNSQWATYGDQLLVDPSGKWLTIESSKGIAVWEIASGKMIATFENASTPVWVKHPEPGLVFLNADHSLNFAQADLNWSPVILLSNIQTPIAGIPGGSEIVFSRYNPFAGGSSFWAVDTATMGVRLLSEAKTESGKVEQFAISPDGKKIAFVNQKNVLYLVTLEP